MGLEPTAFAVTGRRCNQLNYTPAFFTAAKAQVNRPDEKQSQRRIGIIQRINPLPEDRELALRVLIGQNFLHFAQHMIVNPLEILLLGL